MLLQSTNSYSITVSQEFANQFWKKELTQIVYELYPGIMNTLKAINFKVELCLWSVFSNQKYSVLLPGAPHRHRHPAHCWTQN